MAIFGNLKTSPTDLLLTAPGTNLITNTLEDDVALYFERITITYGNDGDIDNDKLSGRK